MTYAGFLLIFLIPWIILELYFFIKYYKENSESTFKGILFLSVMAMIYTTPWDNYLVKNKIWWYGEDKVLAVIGYVPIEEYTFFILQTIMSGLFLFFILKKIPTKVSMRTLTPKITGVIFFLITTILGIMWFLNDSTKYLGLIVGWASPVFLIQWAFGGDIFWQNKKSYLISIFAPSIYLWIADAIAIKLEIWTISQQYTTGIFLYNLPIEEAIFFVATNMMVVQGLQLFWYYSELYKWGSTVDSLDSKFQSDKNQLRI
jgi:lycopene beta-cyclase